MRTISMFALLSLALSGGCAQSAPAPDEWQKPESLFAPVRPAALDPHSHARPELARVRHLSWDARVDFSRRRIEAVADLTIAQSPGATELHLDARDLDIRNVYDQAGIALSYHLGPDHPMMGRDLVVRLRSDTDHVIVRYRTTEGAQALQWLTPAQTVGKKLPYLFTQGQAILTRTYIPLQDSPGVRITYDATVRVPKTLAAVMSAEHKGDRVDGDERVFTFAMPEAIPPYLIALAVGDIAFQELGPRTGVYAEPGVLPAAAAEFADVENMMTAVEELYGPYRWGRYDILVLPPSFPFGGMENPRLTFLSPTTIAGDKSLTSVVAHELAHSWSGNLVTNAAWADFWLNEGFTTYIENRILEKIYGKRRAKLVESIGRRDLLEELDDLGRDNPATALCRPIDDENPDDSINSIPYDKGSAFLRMLEVNLGREKFDAFLRTYFDDNAFSSMTTKKFSARLEKSFGADKLDALQVNSWLYRPGLPDNVPAVESDTLTQIKTAAGAFAKGQPLAQLSTQDFSSLEWVLFMRALPRSLDTQKLAALDQKLQLSTTKNSELRFEFLKLAVANHYDPAVPSLEQFVTSQGRRRLVRPMYDGLMKSDWGRDKAQRIYRTARASYHPLTQETLDGIVGEP